MRASLRCDDGTWTSRQPRPFAPHVAPTAEDDPSTLTFYEANAASYARETLALEVDDRMEDFARSLPAGGRVLDAGCGAGRDLVALGRCGLAAFGVERSATLSAIARALSSRPVTVADFRRLPFADRSFNGVWASASLLHLPRHDLVPALQGLAAALVPAGRIHASFRSGYGMRRWDDGRLFTLYQIGELRSAATAAGLRLVEIQTERGRPAAGAETWLALVAEAR